MSTKTRILQVLSRRKTGMTSFDLTDRLGDVENKTVRNTLGELIREGSIEHDEYQYLHHDRYVNGYRAVA